MTESAPKVHNTNRPECSQFQSPATHSSLTPVIHSFLINKQPQFFFQQLFVRQIELVLGDKKLVGDRAGGVFHQDLILIRSQDNADGGLIIGYIFFAFKIIEIKVHLADVLVVDFAGFQIDEDKEAFRWRLSSRTDQFSTMHCFS